MFDKISDEEDEERVSGADDAARALLTDDRRESLQRARLRAARAAN